MPRLSRRTLVRGLILFLFAFTAQPAFPKTYAGPTARQSAAARRPLRMLALGDSVMWGQGLLDKNKFSYRLRDWLCEQRGGGSCQNAEDVQLHVEAHSGAIIAKPGKRREREAEERFTRASSPLRYAGEVNNAYPTLWGQLELARRHYRNSSIPPGEVDLILVNGGINDLNASRLLIRRLFGDGDVRKLAKKYSGEEMKRFLLEVAEAFPNARIVVPGYFPLVSESTPPFILWETVKEWVFGGPEAEAEEVEAFQADWVERQTESTGPAARTTSLMRALAERSRQFVRASNDALKEAVEHLNKERPLAARPAGSQAPPADASARGLFVPVPFAADNAYAAPNTFLWRLGRKTPPNLVLKCAEDNFVTRFVVNDEVQAERPCMCDQAGRKNDPICFRAGAFHPNTRGANAYFEAIRGRLEPVVASTGWAARD